MGWSSQGTMYSVHPSLRAEPRFPGSGAEITRSTDHPPVPEDRIARLQSPAVHRTLLPSDLSHLAHTLVPENHRPGCPGILPGPHMHVRPADSRGRHPHKHLTVPQLRNLDLSQPQRFVERLQNHRPRHTRHRTPSVSLSPGTDLRTICSDLRKRGTVPSITPSAK